MRAIAVVPARAGSIRVTNKNFREFRSTSLTEIAIRVAVEAGFFWKIILSTDSIKGRDLCTKWGVEFHQRSPDASSDDATASDVLFDLASSFSSMGLDRNDYLFYLQPTSPLRTAKLLQELWRELCFSSASGLVTVTPIDSKYWKALTVRNSRLVPITSGRNAVANYQSLETLYLPNGNAFVFQWGLFLDGGVFPVGGLTPVIQSLAHSLDIDTEEDFQEYLNRT